MNTKKSSLEVIKSSLSHLGMYFSNNSLLYLCFLKLVSEKDLQI